MLRLVRPPACSADLCRQKTGSSSRSLSKPRCSACSCGEGQAAIALLDSWASSLQLCRAVALYPHLPPLSVLTQNSQKTLSIELYEVFDREMHRPHARTRRGRTFFQGKLRQLRVSAPDSLAENSTLTTSSTSAPLLMEAESEV